eukprot:12587112-Alexandrium_andersonii.AAC.1
MSASLVGSEMCIRDRGTQPWPPGVVAKAGRPITRITFAGVRTPQHVGPVSYTHLTLPTICSV